MRRRQLFAVVVVLGWCVMLTAQEQVVFEDHFESGDQAFNANWTLWTDSSWVPQPDRCNGGAENCYLSSAFLRIDYDHSHYYPAVGNTGVRHERMQPYWCGRWHEETGLASYLDKTITASIWQFEDYSKQAPFPPGDPEYNDHDQVQSWLVLMSEDESEYFAVGVHAHKFSPAPLADWWDKLSWGTASDGWHTTTYPRSQGWRRLRIVVHPYRGQVGDVEFYVAPDPGVGNQPQYVLVGSGRRQPGESCRGVPITRVAMGANPALVPEDYIANTYENFWYDDVVVTVDNASSPCANPNLRFDTDNDGDVDQTDFAVFQACYTGDTPPGPSYDCGSCRCMNSNQDNLINGDDLNAFETCASGPGIAADVTCDNALAPP